MIEATENSQEVAESETTALKPLKAKRTFWQRVGTIVVALAGALIGFVIAVIVGLATGLIELVC